MQKIKVFLICSLLLFLVAVASTSAQSSELIDSLLGSDEASFGESAYMVAVGSGLADETVSVSEALEMIEKKGLNIKGKSAGDEITLGELSYMIMELFDIGGGIMYSLFPSPRYAARELDFLGFIDAEAHPGNRIAGDSVIRMISSAIDMKEAR